MFLLVIFKDLQQSTPLFIIKFRKMKDIIRITNGCITYNTIRQKENKKYITKKSLYKVIKI